MHNDDRVTQVLAQIEPRILSELQYGHADNLLTEDLQRLLALIDRLRLRLGPLFYQYMQLGSLKARADQLQKMK